MKNALLWKCHDPGVLIGLPEGFVTFGAAFSAPDLPREATLLLPGNTGSTGLLRDIAQVPERMFGLGVGLFLNDPFLNFRQVAKELLGLGVTWLVSLPSMAQHDPGFRSDLEAVGLSVDAELAHLAEARQAGMHTLAVVSSASQAAALARHPADAVLVIPTTADIQISFPSLTRREAMAAAVRTALKGDAPQVPVLTFLRSDELSRSTGAALARPVPFDQPKSP